MKVNQTIFEYKLPIKIKPQKGRGFVAICTDWSDCYAQGDTIDEAILEITAVAQSLIELYKEEDLKIPLKLAEKKVLADVFSIPILSTS